MICRHRAGDPACGSNQRDYSDPAPPKDPKTPDPSRYYIIDSKRCGSHLVLKVKYPNCSSCAYEGSKVMVFLNITEAMALRWRHINPHFRDPKVKVTAEQAPSPAARFPGSDEGWTDAVQWAIDKSKNTATR